MNFMAQDLEAKKGGVSQRGRQRHGERGMILVTTLLFLLLFTVMGSMLLYMITSSVKISGLTALESTRFYGTEGGVLAVAAYMTLYRRTDPPNDILNTPAYATNVTFLATTIRNAPGYASLWKGMDVQINSKSPAPPADLNEVEAIVFIPNAPIGYGNE